MEVSTSVAPRQRPKGGQGGASPGGFQLPTPIGRGAAKGVSGQTQQTTPGNSK